MHIAVDARELTGKPTGVGRYLSHLLDEWRQMPEALAHRWTLCVAEGGRRQAAVDDVFEWRTIPGNGGTWWEQRALAAAIRQARPDVLFAPAYTAPLLLATPVVLTIHDVSFFAHPEWFGRREGLRRRLVTRRAARRARIVLTVSAFSRQEIVDRLGVPNDRVRVVRHGIARPASLASADGRPPMVLYVGSIFNRRHVPDLIRAFGTLVASAPDARLEIVGENRTHPREDLDGLARSLGVAGRVTFRSYVDDGRLEQLYSQARAFAFLSEYEGFGLTPLEALAHEVPVVVIDTPVAREVYEDAASYVAAGDVSATATALQRLLFDPALRTTKLEHAQSVLARYCWRSAAVETLEALQQAGARG